jgi:hypothetical protein
MEGPDQKATTATGGRWVKGQSGNPAGRKPGTRNRATRLPDMLTAEDVVTALRVVVEQAIAGDPAAWRLIRSRIPRRRGAPPAPMTPETILHFLAAARATLSRWPRPSRTP